MPDWEDEQQEDQEEEQAQEEQPTDPAAIRAQVEAELRQELGAEYQARLEEDKVRLGQRYDRTIRHARAIGFDIEDDGAMSVKNPTQVLASVTSAGQPKEEEEARLSVLDSDEELTEKTRKMIERRATELAEERVKPVMARVEQLEQGMHAMAYAPLRPVTDRARDALDSIGFGEVADTPEFQQILQAGLREYSPQQIADEQFLETAAMIALSQARRDLEKKGKPVQQKQPGSERERIARIGAAAAVGQTRSSRGFSPPAEQPAADEREMVAFFQAQGWDRDDGGNVDPDYIRMLRDSTGDAQKFYLAKNRLDRAKKGATR